MNFNNQGKRPNFWSQQDMLNLEDRPYNDDNHTIWVGGAVKYLSAPTEQDFELPRMFVSGSCSDLPDPAADRPSRTLTSSVERPF